MQEASIRELVFDLFSQVTGAVEETQCIEEGESCSGIRDMATVVRHYLPDKVAANFSTKEDRVEVFQLKCLEQRASGWYSHCLLVEWLLLPAVLNIIWQNAWPNFLSVLFSKILMLGHLPNSDSLSRSEHK